MWFYQAWTSHYRRISLVQLIAAFEFPSIPRVNQVWFARMVGNLSAILTLRQCRPVLVLGATTFAKSRETARAFPEMARLYRRGLCRHQPGSHTLMRRRRTVVQGLQNSFELHKLTRRVCQRSESHVRACEVGHRHCGTKI